MTWRKWFGLVALCAFVYFAPQFLPDLDETYFLAQSSWSLLVLSVALRIRAGVTSHRIALIEAVSIYATIMASKTMNLEFYYTLISVLFVAEVLVLLFGVPRGLVKHFHADSVRNRGLDVRKSAG